MGGYIGATAVGLVTTAADVQGDITSTDTTPELILKNTSEEDTEGGREGKITFKGEQSGGEETTLAQIQASHDGTSDDEKGDLIFKVNDGSDGASPTERLRIGSDGATTITTEGNEDSLVLKSNDADANAGPKLQFNRNSASAADADLIGEMRYSGRNDASQNVDYARIRSQVSDASDGTEDGQLQIATIVAGTMRRRVDFDATETVFNDASVDLDFRVESDNNANALFVKGSDGSIGIGTASPTAQVHIIGDDATDQVIIENNDASNSSAPDLVLYRNSASPADNDAVARIDFQGKNDAGEALDYGVILQRITDASDGTEDGKMSFYVASGGEVAGATDTETLTLHSPELVEINTSADTSDNTAFRIVGGTSGYSSLQFGDTSDGNRGMWQYNHSTDHLRLQVNDQECLEIENLHQTFCFDNNANFDGAGSVSGNNASSKQNITIGTGYIIAQRNSATPLYVNRMTNDGVVFNIYGQGTAEGNISVSGTTVSYNGGHLSRWSQLSDGSKDTSIVKGTVMTNLDKMAVWTHAAKKVGDDILDVNGEVIGQETEAKDAWTENNEQLNCMAVSSEEGDANVAGVFVNWDYQDDGFNDMNIAMTGDMVIRIAKGTTVARGDLLMSAGDGTAKPQGDDIVRSKTIAKVTSTNVSKTYDDGTYLVPCVLMAC